MFDQGANLIRQERFAVLRCAAKLDRLFSVSHAFASVASIPIQQLLFASRAVLAGTIGARGHLDKTRIEFHPETQTKLL